MDDKKLMFKEAIRELFPNCNEDEINGIYEDSVAVNPEIPKILKEISEGNYDQHSFSIRCIIAETDKENANKRVYSYDAIKPLSVDLIPMIGENYKPSFSRRAEEVLKLNKEVEEKINNLNELKDIMHLQVLIV